MSEPHFLFHRGVPTSLVTRLRAAFGGVDVLYAVKTNPHPLVLGELRCAGAGVEVASVNELTLAVDAGFDPAAITYTNPMRTIEWTAHAARAGVRRFVVDSVDEVARTAAGVRQSGVDRSDISILIRLAVDQSSAAVPLGVKFGVALPDVGALAKLIDDEGLGVSGVAFHTGSQVTSPAAFAAASRLAAVAMDSIGGFITDPVIDLGGGWPAPYAGTVVDEGALAEAALSGLGRWADDARLVIEPGRFIAGPSFSMVTHVIGTAIRGGERWVHVDGGVYNGALEALMTPSLVMPPSAQVDGPVGRCVLAGPTCDSADVLCRDVELPLGVSDGDQVTFSVAGAYTWACASAFNGFQVLDVVAVDGP